MKWFAATRHDQQKSYDCQTGIINMLTVILPGRVTRRFTCELCLGLLLQSPLQTSCLSPPFGVKQPQAVHTNMELCIELKEAALEPRGISNGSLRHLITCDAPGVEAHLQPCIAIGYSAA